MKIFSWVSPSCLAFLKSRMSSGVAGIADCKVHRAGDAGSNGKQSNSLKHDILDLVQLAHLCTYVLEYIPCAFERVAFYSPDCEEQLEFDQCC